MDILNEMYHKTVTENERNLCFWTDYLENLKALDFSTYSEKLKVPVLVPIGSKILFRGELKHTNEVTVSLGADYFVKCSTKQADILRQHRIKGAQEKVDTYTKEKEYLENQMSFTKQNIYDNQGQEIIEYHTDEEDKVWRAKHKENVKQYMQKRGKEKANTTSNDVTDEELWNRLEELELQEELENELNDMNTDVNLSSIRETKTDTFVVKEEDSINIKETASKIKETKHEEKAEKEMKNKKVTFEEAKTHSKLDMLQQVIDRQNELDERLQDLKNRERGQSRTEEDLLAKLEELEQLDELEDEMNRLDDMIDNEDIDDETDETDEEEKEEPSRLEPTKLERRVSFVDEDNSETLELTFKHSEVEPDNSPYDPEKGIQKPSDIYKAHSSLFESGTTSILKKSKYATDNDIPEMLKKPETKVEKTISQTPLEEDRQQEHIPHQTIVIKDVVEKMGQGDNTLQTEKKPMSLFKKKRMQNKS
ncbi:unconventional prefoldin RPB5 interactor [Anticarsia gemmatalis]|uniref:unconventional prefoldin RPB5 interactor n=1 Tax=Anticarsia gemmatalis TaxID=129554 RepID=UPI003F777F6D